jgi:hypothetical protein
VSLPLADGLAADYAYGKARPFVSDDGVFVMRDVPENRYKLRVSGGDVVPARIEVDVRGSGVTDAGTIRVTRGIPERHGAVVNEEREPVTVATVTMVTSNEPSRNHRFWSSEDDGTFLIPAVPHGTHVRLRADLQGAGASDWVTVAPTDREVTLVMEASTVGTVRGVLVDQGDLSERTVILSHEGDVPPGTGATEVRGLAQTEPGGIFVFEQVPAGSYRLWAPLGGGEFARHPAPVEVGKHRDVSVVFDVPSSPRVSR